MSIGGGSNDQSSESETKQTSPAELEAYFSSLNQLTGGQLGTFAQQGTAPTYYDALTQAELAAIGGAGATQKNELATSYQQQQDQINKNSSMTYAQSSQASQDAANSYNNQVNAINKEVEAAMTGLASQEAMNKYQSDLANAALSAQDLALLSQIYYGGMGSTSTSSSSGSGGSFHAGIGGSSK